MCTTVTLSDLLYNVCGHPPVSAGACDRCYSVTHRLERSVVAGYVIAIKD